jgi:flagellar basal body-associated protein FliL
MARLDDEIKTGRSKKVIYIGIAAIAALIILATILIVALKGKSDPKKPDKKVDYIFNPYFLSQDQQQTQFSSRYYNLGFDK